MRFTPIALIAVGLFAATTASAQARVSDVEYLKASRCHALATTAESPDAAAMEAFVKAESRGRTMTVMDMAAKQKDKAKREARSNNAERQARLQAELNGPCQSFKS